MRLKSFGLICLVAFLAAACGTPPAPPEPTGSSGVTKETGPVTIRVLETAEGPSVGKLAEAFQAKFPAYKVEVVQVEDRPGTTYDTIKGAVQGARYDIVPIVGFDDMIQEKLLLELDPYIQKNQTDLKPFEPGIALQQMTSNGHLYGLPWAGRPRMFLYNKELLAQAGVEKPAENWTWEQFQGLAAQVTEGEGEQKIWGFSAPIPEGVWRTFSEQELGVNTSMPPVSVAEAGMKLFYKMVFEDKSMTPSDRNTIWDRGGSTRSKELFAAGRAVFGMDFLENVGKPEFEWDVLPFPASTPEGHRTTLAYSQVLGIASTAAHPEAAFAFLSYVTGPEGALFAAQNGLMPFYRSEEIKQAWFASPLAPPPGTEYLFRAPLMWGFRYTSGHGKLSTIQNRMISEMHAVKNKLLSGYLTPEEALRLLKEQHDTYESRK